MSFPYGYENASAISNIFYLIEITSEHQRQPMVSHHLQRYNVPIISKGLQCWSIARSIVRVIIVLPAFEYRDSFAFHESGQFPMAEERLITWNIAITLVDWDQCVTQLPYCLSLEKHLRIHYISYIAGETIARIDAFFVLYRLPPNFKDLLLN